MVSQLGQKAEIQFEQNSFGLSINHHCPIGDKCSSKESDALNSKERGQKRVGCSKEGNSRQRDIWAKLKLYRSYSDNTRNSGIAATFRVWRGGKIHGKKPGNRSLGWIRPRFWMLFIGNWTLFLKPMGCHRKWCRRGMMTFKLWDLCTYLRGAAMFYYSESCKFPLLRHAGLRVDGEESQLEKPRLGPISVLNINI